MAGWLAYYWPALVPFVFLPIAIEVWLLATGRRTISGRIQTASRRHPWLKWITIGIVGYLIVHFFWPEAFTWA